MAQSLPIYRRDVLSKMRSNTRLTGKELFSLIMKDTDIPSERREGHLFETLCILLTLVKCLVPYTTLWCGQLQSLKQIINADSLLNIKVEGGGSNIVDMTLKQDNTLIVFTCKYKKNMVKLM